MPGGLIQVVAYGSQDLFLTGTPEITYFKVVYRRYTNYSTDTVAIPFDGTPGFGKVAGVTIPKIADIMHKVHLQLTIPSVNYPRDTTSSTYKTLLQNAQTDYNTALSNYNIVTSYMNLNINAYRQAYNTYIAINTSVSDMVNEVISAFGPIAYNLTTSSKTSQTDANAIIVNNFYSLFTNLITASGSFSSTINFDPKWIGMNEVIAQFGSNINSISTSVLITAMQFGVTQSERAQQYFYSLLLDTKDALANIQNTNRKFAWVDKLGHSIIDYIEVTIGGTTIDKHYGRWIDIWYELTSNTTSESIYNKLIGNIPELTTFDRTVKPSYTIYLPLQFWFCRNNGLALPLVSLEYHDVDINIKLRNAEDVSYIELESSEDQIYIDDIFTDLGIDVDASLLIDFIYLDSQERKKFAQGSHEYLIEQIQVIDQVNVSTDNTQVLLDFNHPCKELIWIAQKNSYTNNTDGSTKCEWTNYGINDITGKTNPIQFSGMTFNGYTRIDNYPGIYFNCVQPYTYHTRSPVDGINCYSFSLDPEEHQPGGTCNMSRISRAMLQLTLDPNLFLTNIGEVAIGVIQDTTIDTITLISAANSTDNYYVDWIVTLGTTVYTVTSYEGSTRVATLSPDLGSDVTAGQTYTLINPNNVTDANIYVFAINYNVLRFISGMAGIAYV